MGRLDRIVQEVLYLNRRDRAQPESIDAAAYLANFAAEFAAVEKASATALDIQVRTAQRIHFDRQHLDQVLWNIARNAWRHGRKLAGSVRIVVAPWVAPGKLIVDVFDDGPGVSASALPHLFEPFFTTDLQGTGLGLYIARELLEYIEGSGGAHFRITVKAA